MTYPRVFLCSQQIFDFFQLLYIAKIETKHLWSPYCILQIPNNKFKSSREKRETKKQKFGKIKSIKFYQYLGIHLIITGYLQ